MSDRRPFALALAAGLLVAAAALLVAGPAAERLHLATRAVQLQEPALAGSSAYLVATVLLSALVVAQTVRTLRRRKA